MGGNGLGAVADSISPHVFSQLDSNKALQCGGQQAGSSGRLVKRSVRRGAPAPPPEP